MTHERVWLVAKTILKTYGFDSEMKEKNLDGLIQTIRDVRKFIPVSVDRFPKKMWASDSNPRLKKLPHFADLGGLYAVSKAVADFVSQFDLGTTQLHPVSLLQFDQKTPLVEGYMFLNISEQKNAFERSLSRNFRLAWGGRRRKSAPLEYVRVAYEPNDKDIVLNPTALSGVDLWTDPGVADAVFFSDRLYKALMRAGVEMLGEQYHLIECEVISAH